MVAYKWLLIKHNECIKTKKLCLLTQFSRRFCLVMTSSSGNIKGCVDTPQIFRFICEYDSLFLKSKQLSTNQQLCKFCKLARDLQFANEALTLWNYILLYFNHMKARINDQKWLNILHSNLCLNFQQEFKKN